MKYILKIKLYENNVYYLYYTGHSLSKNVTKNPLELKDIKMMRTNTTLLTLFEVGYEIHSEVEGNLTKKKLEEIFVEFL
jgi:hypothetical protein